MARLLVQHLAIYSNENVPHRKNIGQYGFKFLPNTKWNAKKCQRLAIFSPNLATLAAKDMPIWESFCHFVREKLSVKVCVGGGGIKISFNGLSELRA